MGQDLTRTATDLDTLRAKDDKPPWDRIDTHINTWRPSALVVGLPLDAEGRETQMSARTRKFGQRLKDRYNLPVYWVNEYLTSDRAQRELSAQPGKTNRKRDQVAARLILETFFEQ